MINHPHDCPVCDEGGECHLQDMTVMTGHDYRALPLRRSAPTATRTSGPFVNHEMNRCIQCYRCVRFYRDYAGGRDLDVFACAQPRLLRPRTRTATLESEFSGNLVEVCPTGVFTDKTLKQHYTRKWDLQTAPSVCVHCALGCNTIARRALRQAAAHPQPLQRARSTATSSATAAATATSSSTARRRPSSRCCA